MSGASAIACNNCQCADFETFDHIIGERHGTVLVHHELLLENLSKHQICVTATFEKGHINTILC